MARILPIEDGRFVPVADGEREDHVDVAIAKLAAVQHGVVSRRQLLRVGASKAAIDHRIAVRRLQPIHLGVYAVGHAALRITGVYGAAVLACGDGAVASYRSAAHLLGLLAGGGSLIDVTVPRRGSRRRPKLRIHTARGLHRDDVTVHQGVPCTSVARTLLDLAGLDPPRLLDRAVEQAQILRSFDGRALEAALTRAARRRGTRRLRRLLVDLAGEPPPVKTELERRFLELVRGAQLPEPAVNQLVAGYLVGLPLAAATLGRGNGRARHPRHPSGVRDRPPPRPRPRARGLARRTLHLAAGRSRARAGGCGSAHEAGLPMI